MRKVCSLLIVFLLWLVATGIPCALCYPYAGSDYLDSTTATIELQIIWFFNETVTVNGPTAIARGTPYDPGDGRIKIDTEITSMHLTGMSVHIGSITVIESPHKASEGYVQQMSAGVDYPAISFFGVFVEIYTVLASPNDVLHNDVAKPMTAQINGIPPWGATYNSTDPVPLKNEENMIIGFIGPVIHKVGSAPHVGGSVFFVDPLGLLAPYIGLTSTVLVAAVVTGMCVKRVRRRKEKQ